MLISNASTLILLAKVSVLSIFLDSTKEVLVPNVVYEEVKKKDSFEVLLIKKEVKNQRIKNVDVKRKNYESVLKQFKLDEGEAAAYTLFKKEKGEAILTDDGELIKLCKVENVPFVIAMAVVIELYKEKKLEKEEALEKLNELYGYGRYSDEIYEYFRGEVK